MMERITVDWCKERGFVQQKVNVATDITYHYNDDACAIIFTQRTIGEKKLFVANRLRNKTIEFTTSTDITERDLCDLCNFIDIKSKEDL